MICHCECEETLTCSVYCSLSRSLAVIVCLSPTTSSISSKSLQREKKTNERKKTEESNKEVREWKDRQRSYIKNRKMK